ncbi:MAG: HAMP domain-containing histidine kinase [Pseudobutyrivibrio ruminis]|nr:HAMP domain-containing histidine kinase [Pseudobutyrivibrio ruminis]
MFTKLRNKFLILNMSMTSTVMITAFAVIYIISYNNVNSEITKKLNLQAGMQTVIEGTELPDDTENSKPKTLNRRFSPDDTYSFSIYVDGNGEILEIDSPFNMPEETYNKAADIAWNNKKNSSTITLEGKQWEYAIAQMKKQVIQRNGQSYTVAENKYQIMFLDVTMYKKTLFQLLITLLSVGLIMLFAIFIISLYFANRAIKPIAEAWERQKQFVADASHELKTPLSIINANYDVLLTNQEETIQSQLKWLDYIKIGTDRMTKLINDLLSLAKMEDVRFPIQKVTFNMSDAINDVILSMEPVVAEKDIKLTHLIEPDIIVKSDQEKIKLVVTILFDNAVKYTLKPPNHFGQSHTNPIK